MITQAHVSQVVPPVSASQALEKQDMTPMYEAANTPVIHVDRLSRTFGKLEAVKDISFDVYPGEIFGFLGPNGAGKSTTINMLCTLLRPTSGSATIAGYDIVRQRVKVRESIGLIFQESGLDENLTADENLRFHAAVYGLPAQLSKQRREELLKLVDLDDRKDSLVRTFSGGMKRRLKSWAVAQLLWCQA